MFNIFRSINTLLLVTAFLWLPATLCGAAPLAVFITFQDDPHTSMTVQWVATTRHTIPEVVYRSEGAPWRRAAATAQLIPNGYGTNEPPYYIHRAQLKGLQPGATYEFVVTADPTVYKFKSLPILEEGIRFIVGGDVYSKSLEMTGDAKQLFAQINRAAAALDPSFVLLGGDLAYGDGVGRWVEWLRLLSRDLVSADGRLIPIVSAIGNHDCPNKFDSALYRTLFPSPTGKTYYTIDLSAHCSIVVLDTGHGYPIEGEQTQWLEKTLRQLSHKAVKLAVYHVPAYPGYRALNNSKSVAVRKQWLPLFEKHGITMAFEHHDHIFKRTKPLLAGKVDIRRGIVYLGDGAWGVNAEKRDPQTRWYLDALAQQRHFFLVTVHNDGVEAQAIDPEGNVFDYCHRDARR